MRGVSLMLGMVLSLASLGSAAAAAQPKYGEPTAALERGALAQAVEDQIKRLAPVVSDGRLQAAMDQLLAHWPANGAPPVALTERALWLAGIVEPMPYLVTMTVPNGAEADVLEQLNRLLPPVLERGHYRRVAASEARLTSARTGSSKASGTTRLLLVALQESFLEMAPVSRSSSSGGRITLTGKVLSPFERPGLFVTTPDGAVERIDMGASGASGDRFRAAFHCTGNGMHQVEIVGEDRLGDAVLANFPIYCGVPVPTTLDAQPSEAEPPWRDAAAVEARLIELVQADRAKARLPRISVDAALSAVARGHSEEMRDHGFFGHVSPTTGTAADRLRRAGIQPLRVLENLARARSTVEAERGLMDSPSHRANLLSPDVERVGIGVALGPVPDGGGERELYVTQLFAHLGAPLDPDSADRDLRVRLDNLRRGAHRPLLKPDPALDAIARQVADNVATAAGKAGQGMSDPVERALGTLSEKYRWVKTVVAQAGELAQLGASPALLDGEATHAGIAAMPAKAGSKGEAGGIFLVVLLGAAR